jgi:hypothetical protein
MISGMSLLNAFVRNKNRLKKKTKELKKFKNHILMRSSRRPTRKTSLNQMHLYRELKILLFYRSQKA